MHSSRYRLGTPSGRCINRQRGRVQILLFYFIRFILFYYLLILPSGEGLVPFVHPCKYARAVSDLKFRGLHIFNDNNLH